MGIKQNDPAAEVNPHEVALYGGRTDADLLGDLVSLARGEGNVGARAWYAGKGAVLMAVRDRMGHSLRAFQVASHTWVLKCLGVEAAHDIRVRLHRFLEEALELVQSLGLTREEAHQLVDYVFGREIGEPRQELGGVLTTLGTLAAAAGLDMQDDGERELARVNQPEMMEKIARKHFAKPAFSALPEAADRPLAYADTAALLLELQARGAVGLESEIEAHTRKDAA